MWKIETYFVIKILLSAVLLTPFLGQENDLKIIVKDQLTAENLPFSTVIICGEKYTSDQQGEVILDKFHDRCIIVAQRLGYEIFMEEVHLKDKKTIIIFLKEEPIELDQFTIKAQKVKPLKVDDILKKMMVNFKTNHIPENLKGKLEEMMIFSFGYEPIIQRTGDLNFEFSNGKFNWEKMSSNYNFSDLNTKAYDKLVSVFVSNPSVTVQAFEERMVNRSDVIENNECGNLSPIQCYLINFFPVKRNLLYNPVFNNGLKTKDFDHFGFINPEFLATHKFKLVGVSQMNGRECYKVRIEYSSKSIPVSIAGNSAKNFFVPHGTIFIDALSLAILRIEYAYSLNKRNSKKSYYQDEYNSGEIFFENIINFDWIAGKWLPSTQFLEEKDRSVKVVNESGKVENGYLIKHINFFYP